MKLEDGFDSNYRYVLVAARRARQLQNGSQPLVASRSTKACRVAQDEIAAGKVKFVQGEGQAPKERLAESNFPAGPTF
jgi:DNA-directed RNA polymerase subunit omega